MPVLKYPYEMDGPELTPVLEYPYEMDGPELTKDQIIDLFIAMGYEYVKVIDLVRGEDYEPAEV